MYRQMLKSKIHRAIVTDANLNYVGSITIDEELMEKADILENEKVAVLNIDNGERFETYAINAKRGSGVICLNGAAARLVQVGDKVIIISYGSYNETELSNLKPKIIHVNQKNKIIS
jgi:aspartate 1-decarboxylase